MPHPEPDAATGPDPVATAQALLELYPTLDTEARKHTHHVAVGLLTGAVGREGWAAELLAAAERTDRPTGPQWLAELVLRLRPQWDRQAAIDAARWTRSLADGSRLTVTDEGGGLALYANHDPDNDYVRGATVKLTYPEARELAQAVLAQPGMADPGRPEALRWEAVTGPDAEPGDECAMSARPRPPGVLSEAYSVGVGTDTGWWLHLEQARKDEARPRRIPMGRYAHAVTAKRYAQRFENAGGVSLTWGDADWTDMPGEQRAASDTRIGHDMASAYYALYPEHGVDACRLFLYDVLRDGGEGGGMFLGTHDSEEVAKAYAQRHEIDGMS